MAKNKEKKQRQRTFKVGADLDGIPFIRFGGKYLGRELGLNGGERLEVTRIDDCIILRQFSIEEVEQYEATKQANEQKALLRKLFPRKQQKQLTALMVAENRADGYSIANEINHNQILEKHRKIRTNLIGAEQHDEF